MRCGNGIVANRNTTDIIISCWENITRYRGGWGRTAISGKKDTGSFIAGVESIITSAGNGVIFYGNVLILWGLDVIRRNCGCNPSSICNCWSKKITFSIVSCIVYCDTANTSWNVWKCAVVYRNVLIGQYFINVAGKMWGY